MTSGGMTNVRPLPRSTGDLEGVQPFVGLLRAQAESLPGARLGWLANRRAAALAAAQRIGLPTQKAESWRNTPLRLLKRHDYDLPAAAPNLDRAPALLEDAQRLVFLDGLQAANLGSAPEGPAGVVSLAVALAQDPGSLEELLTLAPEASAFQALNLALFQDGALVAVPEKTRLERPLEIVYVNGLVEGARTAHPRQEILLGAGSEALLVEQHLGIGEAPRFLNHATRIDLGAGARLTHVVVVAEGAETLHLGHCEVSVARDAAYRQVTLFLGGALCRRDLRVVLQAPNAEVTANAAYLLKDGEQADLVTELVHRAPQTRSQAVIKGALADSSRQGVQGCITVEPGAAHADGRLSAKTLLLSDRATINAKPELRIFHDDVQCAHGATSGKLDENALFYLRSRGMPEGLARRLLIGAFVAETLEGLPAPVAGPLQARLERKLMELQP